MRARSATLAAASLGLVLAGCGRNADSDVEAGDIEAGDVAAGSARPEGPSRSIAEGYVERFADLDEGIWLVSDGWTNGDWMANDFLARQITTGPDGLAITLAPSTTGEKRFSSGEIRTWEHLRHGYFETVMQPPRGSGLVTGLFTYTGPFFGDPWDEIDIEILGKNTRAISFTYFNDGERDGVEIPLGFDAADGLHTYGFEWTDDSIRWYVDGELKHEATGESLAPPVTPQMYFLNLWNSDTLTDWVGPIDEGGGPWTLRVTCMAYAPRYEGRSICADE